MTTTKEVLIQAKSLIETKATWIQSAYARDADGFQKVSGMDDGAVCWCAVGALERITQQDSGSVDVPGYSELVDAANELFSGVGGPEAVNDDEDCTSDEAHANVMRMYDYAIEHADD